MAGIGVMVWKWGRLVGGLGELGVNGGVGERGGCGFVPSDESEMVFATYLLPAARRPAEGT